MGSHHFDALVVGGGIVGTACARELALAGLHVAICEANDHLGGGATAAGMGHLAVMNDSEPQFALTNFSQRLWREVARELPADVEYHPYGSLWIAADEEEFAEVERQHHFYSGHGIPVEILDSKQLREAEPILRPGLTGALLMAADSVCNPPCAARYFAKQLTAAGGEVLLGKTIAQVSDSSIVTNNGEVISAGAIILANGTTVQRLIPDVQVQPRKGHLLITDSYPGFIHHQLIELGYLKSAHLTTADSVAFNAQPRVTGQILIGSSRQYGVEDPAVDPQILHRMLNRAIEYLPALCKLVTLRSWAGFRAATSDKLPLIGRCPGYQRVYLATGHEGLGISTSLATARLLADEILVRDSEISRLPYQPARNFALHN